MTSFNLVSINLRYHARMTVRIAPHIQTALAQNRPVVALESTVITHGLPRPQNLELAHSLQETIRRAGAIPATIGILKGELIVGLSDAELAHLAHNEAEKASLWNLAALLAKGQDAGTTVATTLHAASLAGIKVFATGGVGGVHHDDFDESADLGALARYPLVTVCAGAKSILNVAATVERLETLGVPLLAYGSDYLAGFHVPQTPYRVAARCDSAAEVARCYLVQQELGLTPGLLLSNPVSQGLDEQALAGWLEQAHREAPDQLSGFERTPYLLARLAELSAGQTVEVNIRLLKENAQLAAIIAIHIADEIAATRHRHLHSTNAASV